MYEDLTVVIPTINEEDCIENTVKELNAKYEAMLGAMNK